MGFDATVIDRVDYSFKGSKKDDDFDLKLTPFR